MKLASAFLLSNQFARSIRSYHNCNYKCGNLEQTLNTVKYMTSNDLSSAEQFPYNDDEEEEEEDDDDYGVEEYINSLTPLEKKKMAKEFFSKILDYNEDMRPEFVHIILFNVGTNREGAHTIEFPKDSGNNVLLAFEDEFECGKFIEGLKDQQFFEPVVSFYGCT